MIDGTLRPFMVGNFATVFQVVDKRIVDFLTKFFIVNDGNYFKIYVEASCVHIRSTNKCQLVVNRCSLCMNKTLFIKKYSYSTAKPRFYIRQRCMFNNVGVGLARQNHLNVNTIAGRN